jgi:hypothetical protein
MIRKNCTMLLALVSFVSAYGMNTKIPWKFNIPNNIKENCQTYYRSEIYERFRANANYPFMGSVAQIASTLTPGIGGLLGFSGLAKRAVRAFPYGDEKTKEAVAQRLNRALYLNCGFAALNMTVPSRYVRANQPMPLIDRRRDGEGQPWTTPVVVQIVEGFSNPVETICLNGLYISGHMALEAGFGIVADSLKGRVEIEPGTSEALACFVTSLVRTAILGTKFA